ncbi:MAG: rfbD [Ferruginibacter sp.]|nr:rfbD [Ferruginibacter sp.]
MMSILVTGANGQLGREFRDLREKYSGYHFIYASREDVSIADEAAVEDLFQNNVISFCINCAAYTAVDKAEAEQDIALQVNETSVAVLARVCKKYNARLIHFSTDYVFDGEGDRPYTEKDKTHPVNFYGETKLAGEKAALEGDPQTMIIRTSWVYSMHGKNFVKTMMRLMCEKESIAVVSDQVGSPTNAADLADAVMTIISKGKFSPGIYHYCNEGVISWFEFAQKIKTLIDSKCIVNAIPTEAYPTPAKRPHYSALDTSKIKQQFGIVIPAWEKSLERCISMMLL